MFTADHLKELSVTVPTKMACIQLADLSLSAGGFEQHFTRQLECSRALLGCGALLGAAAWCLVSLAGVRQQQVGHPLSLASASAAGIDGSQRNAQLYIRAPCSVQRRTWPANLLQPWQGWTAHMLSGAPHSCSPSYSVGCGQQPHTHAHAAHGCAWGGALRQSAEASCALPAAALQPSPPLLSFPQA